MSYSRFGGKIKERREVERGKKERSILLTVLLILIGGGGLLLFAKFGYTRRHPTDLDK